MSRLEELTGSLCPGGVPYLRLDEAAEMQRGTSVTRKEVRAGDIPVISGGREPAYYCDRSNREGACITVAGSGAGAGYVQYWDTPIFVCDAFSLQGRKGMDTKFLYYCLCNMQEKIHAAKKGSGVPHVHISSIESFLVPAPPLSVQREIVRILDRFSALTGRLSQALTREQEARRRQYEFYREQLLGRCGVRRQLGQLALSSRSGGTPLKSNQDYYTDGTIPWLRTQEVVFNEIYGTECFITELAEAETSAKWIPANCVIVAISGASAGRCAINKIPLTTNQHCLNIQIDPSAALYKYVFYCVCSQYTELLRKKEGARGDLNAARILSLEIPVPPLDEQARIVSVLDRFSALYSGLSRSLSAELRARQKQYEFYRDRLLAFPEITK